ncbi:MAG: hypothetical protein N2258_03830 [Brevinematales bacterium]|nr:hypothetical protein [Brevinematales bacterium]
MDKHKSFSLIDFIDNISEHRDVSLGTFFVAFLLFVFAIFTFLKNYKYNDNHLNWLNHDYSKNLLMCSEQNSVFMTEGGDNQVFGSLYFTYAEKIRPDISPYDQKGNIFKRIYGDLRYVDYQTIQRRMQLVDTHLFAGEEPFYVNIRDRKDPYFIPYWQGRRPVYLTWERPAPWELGEVYFQDFKRPLPQDYIKSLGLGDYYYKRYGIMYKVQNIKYKLVDYLEVKKSITMNDAIKLFSDWLKRSVNRDFVSEKVNELKKEGLINVNGDRISFVKMYEPPLKDGYFENLLLRWKEIPNARYFDVLSREIVINYGYQFGEIYRERVNELIELKKGEKNPEIIKNIDSLIKENWEKAKEYYEVAIYYGWDSLSVLHNVGLVYLRNELEDLSAKAGELFRKGVELYPNSFGTYHVLFAYLLLDSFKNPANESKNLEEFEKYLKRLKKVLLWYKDSRGKYDNHPAWRNFAPLEAMVDNLKKIPSSILKEKISYYETVLNSKMPIGQDKVVDFQNTITLLYMRGINFGYNVYVEKADKFLEYLLKTNPDNDGLFNWAFFITLQTQKFEKAYEIGKLLMKKKGFSEIESYYYFGIVSYSLQKFEDTKIALRKFVDLVSEDRKNMVKNRQLIDNANKILSSIK